MKNSKKVVFAVTSGSIPILFKGNNIFISKLEIRDNVVENYHEVFLKDVKKFKWLGPNIFMAENEECIYYVMTKKESKFNKYLAFSKHIPQKGKMFPCTRLLYNYSACSEDSIVTSPVNRITKLSDNLYKIKTRHEYIVKIIN
ncbi:MAG: hypothetical protein J6A15_03570 [Clostridia bacterium]|nr:hypothetical protein [Clostridia bacterium]